MIFGVLLWIGLCVAVAMGAGKRGKNPVAYFFLSALLSPLVGLIILIAGAPAPPPVTKPRSTSARWKCPECGHPNGNDTYRCKTCGYSLV